MQEYAQNRTCLNVKSYIVYTKNIDGGVLNVIVFPFVMEVSSQRHSWLAEMASAHLRVGMGVSPINSTKALVVDENTFCAVYQRLREVWSTQLLELPFKLGGQGQIIYSK